jgi:aryl-alcohol dehydrogenase-like predicted oxidoreductase
MQTSPVPTRIVVPDLELRAPASRRFAIARPPSSHYRLVSVNDADRVELVPGYAISRIINGCWQLTPDHGGGPGSLKKSLRTVAELVDHGFTTFDCADIYAGSEEILGKFRRSLPDPHSIQIHTKLVPNKASLHELNDRKIDAALNRSLQKLGVDQIDLLQFHWWDYDVPGIDRLTQRLLHAQNAGKIRLLGVTNFNTKYLQYLLDAGAAIVSVQAQYSLLDRRPERYLTGSCAEKKINLLPYGVLAGGFLTDKYLGRASPATMNRSLQKYRLIIDEVGGWDTLQRLLELLSGIATKHDTTIDAIAVRWALDQPAVSAIILGIGSRSRAQHNVALGHLQLDDEDRQSIAAHLEVQVIPRGDMYDLERDFDGPHARIIKVNLQDSSENV